MVFFCIGEVPLYDCPRVLAVPYERGCPVPPSRPRTHPDGQEHADLVWTSFRVGRHDPESCWGPAVISVSSGVYNDINPVG